jgi:hypothetical protein
MGYAAAEPKTVILERPYRSDETQSNADSADPRLTRNSGVNKAAARE